MDVSLRAHHSPEPCQCIDNFKLALALALSGFSVASASQTKRGRVRGATCATSPSPAKTQDYYNLEPQPKGLSSWRNVPLHPRLGSLNFFLQLPHVHRWDLQAAGTRASDESAPSTKTRGQFRAMVEC